MTLGDIIFGLVTMVLGAFLGVFLGGLRSSRIKKKQEAKEEKANSNSPFSGIWGQFIYLKNDNQYQGKIVKRDEYSLTHHVLLRFPQHLMINIEGSIFRIRDTDPYKIGNREERKWECIGHCDNQVLMLFYKALAPFDTEGCVLVKLFRDGEYRGYYIANHTQTDGQKHIDMTPVILKKLTYRYAVFDWDNTVRRGYTIFPWIDHLYNNELFNEKTYQEIQRTSDRYTTGEINHDEYAKIVGKLYAQGIKGNLAEDINAVAKEYIPQDQQLLYQDIKKLFDFLHKAGIEIIVVSGAPNQILRYYKDSFHIKELYDLREEVEGGIITGNLVYNYGFSKNETIEKIYREKGCTPYMAFGDSTSDFPLLDKALYPFLVCDKDHVNSSSEYITIINDDPCRQIMNKIQHINA